MKIEVLGKFYDYHSLSIVNRELVKGLIRLKHEVTITPIDSFDPEYNIPVDDLEILESAKSKDFVPDIQIRHAYPPLWRWPIHKETKVVFIQPWEFSKLPSEWAYKMEQFADGLIVPSNWVADRYLEAGLNPEEVHVVPNGYDPELFNTKKEVDTLIKQDNKLVFTYVGCAQYRKGIDILLDAWSKAFVKADNVLLYVKDTPNIYGQSNLLNEVIRMQYSTGCGQIMFDDEARTSAEMASLFKRTQVLVHPFRGEGFGMHIQEAMACGALPLVTHGGPANDFVSEESGIFINTSRTLIDLNSPKVFATKPGDALTIMGSHAWILEPSQEDLMHKMRYIYYHHQRHTVLDKVKNAKLFTWETVAQKYSKALRDIMESSNGPKRLS